MRDLLNTSGHVVIPEMQLQGGKNYLGTGGVKLVISLIMVMVGNRQKWNR